MNNKRNNTQPQTDLEQKKQVLLEQFEQNPNEQETIKKYVQWFAENSTDEKREFWESLSNQLKNNSQKS